MITPLGSDTRNTRSPQGSPRGSLTILLRPWTGELSVTHPPLGPGVTGKYEHELAAFGGIGLTGVEMDAALTHLLGFVRAQALALAAADTAAHHARRSDQERWELSAPLLERG